MDDVGYETAHIKGADVISQLCTMLRQRGLRVVRVHGRECCMPPLDHVPAAEEVVAAEREVVRLMQTGGAARSGASGAGGAAEEVPGRPTSLRSWADGTFGRDSPNGPPSAEADIGLEQRRAAKVSGGAVTKASGHDPCVVAEEVESPPAGSASLAHRKRGITVPGEQVWAFFLQGAKVSVKQVREVHAVVTERSRQSITTTTATITATAAATTATAAAMPISAESESHLPIVRRVILVARDKVADASVEFMRGDVTPERFLLQELTYNLTRHFLVPPHHILDPETEVAPLRKRYPKLALQSRDDALSRFYGLVPGDVVGYVRQRLGAMGGVYYCEVA
jgi:DNA-directed RNA polymerase subunit H (RpoH/RPB5)